MNSIQNDLLSKKQYLFWVLIIVVVIGCGGRMQQATPGLIDKVERQWRTKAVLNYTMVVDVQMNGNIRRNEITVKNGKIDHATVSYKDNSSWKHAQKLNAAQAMAFTVPGLFETVREELNAHARSNLRVAVHPDGAYLQQIDLGPVLQNNQSIPNSEVYIFVRKFEPLPNT
jgi:hypothetical protein